MKDRAHRLLSSGRFERSAEAYLALCKAQPDDALVRLRHADASKRAGNALAAVGSYRLAARLLSQKGHDARARAALKMALDLAPGHPEILRALSALDVAPSSIDDALAQAADIAIEVAAPQPMAEPAPLLGPSTAAEFHRIDANTIAFRRPNGEGWWVVSSKAPVAISEIAVEDVADDADVEIEIDELEFELA